jgi:predicted amidohydrolase
MLKLALGQMRVEPGEPMRNLAHAGQIVADAAKTGANVVLLPEALPFGWPDPGARASAEPIPDGSIFKQFTSLARQFEIHLCTGLIERAGDQLFNSAVLISPEGGLLAHHRKLNELDLAHDLYAQGDRLQVAHTPLGSIGLMVCADAFARGQVIARTLGLMGADVILSPCAWAVPASHDQAVDPYGALWRDNYGPVARDFHLWIAGCSNVGPITSGPWKGRKCIGCSLVVDPSGKPVLQGPYGETAETLLRIDFEPEPRPARGTRWEDYWREMQRRGIQFKSRYQLSR